MLRRFAITVRSAALTICAAAMLSAPVRADDHRPVVVELFTSQGCSSCPQADAFFGSLASRDDVIALGLHVDYWDYIGWKDVFANPAFTRRQKAYARSNGRRSIYTPQMIIQGQEDVVGTHPVDVTDLILTYREAADTVSVELERTGSDEVRIEASAETPIDKPLQVHLVRYRPSARIDVLRGENAGRTLVYSNIVTDWQMIGEWDPRSPLSIRAEAKGDEPVVVLIQRPGPGAIEAAAQLR